MNLENICRKTIALVKEVGEYIDVEQKSFTKDQIRFKGKKDLVTHVDIEAEKQLVEGLRNILPEASFLTEEKTADDSDSNQESNNFHRWIIDPIDGTTNFVHNIPFYAISIALTTSDETKIGIVYNVSLQECFYTWEGGAAYLNDEEIHVSTVAKMTNSLIATGFPYESIKNMESYFNIFRHFVTHAQGIRRLGTAAVDLAYVACGRFEGFYELNLNPWDVAAGAYLVKNAGGRVTDFHGKGDFNFGKSILGSNGLIHDKMLRVVEKHYDV
ncbi:MAG: inositol monophosphatase [Bacteroidetes bacterium]|nr:inositol monophosphatase [Bacteroidota bacterium]